jgi:hypothetical protein
MQNSPLTRSGIFDAKSDEEPYNILAAELMRQIEPCSSSNIKEFLIKLPSFSVGLRSMAAVYDLGWHFMNRYSLELAQETLSGLIELNTPHAEIFAEPIKIANNHWDFIGSSDFIEKYLNSPLDLELAPLNKHMWELQNIPERTVLDYWPTYARKYPERIVSL